MKFKKLRLIWNIIRGRAVMYRIYCQDGIVQPNTKKAAAVECIFNKCKYLELTDEFG